MTVDGVDELRAAFERIGMNIEGEIQKALEVCAIKVEGDAKLQAPVDTGLLRKSITHRTGEDYAEVGTSTEYAPFQEFGTSKMPARPFLLPALNQNRNFIKNTMTLAVKKGAES
jgi:HK97 gp10 family phage protein